MAASFDFDVNITLSDLALRWPVFPDTSSSEHSEPNEDDEFDLDFRYLDAIGPQPKLLSPQAADELMPVGSGFFGITCSNTCAVVVGGGNTCAVTCSSTCEIFSTCGNTCVGNTCAGNTCQASCPGRCGVGTKDGTFAGLCC